MRPMSPSTTTSVRTYQQFGLATTLMQLPIYPLAVEKLRKDPYTLPPGYHWDTLNLDDPLVVSCFTKQKWRTKNSSIPMNLTPLSAEGAVRAAERELRRGRRQHVPLRLLAGVPAMGAPASGLTQGLARRSQVRSISVLRPSRLPNSCFICSIRVTKNNKLFGFISAVPATIRVYDK